MTIRRTHYTDEFRASAVLMLEAAGYPDRVGALSQVSKNLGVPRITIQRWYTRQQNPPPHILVHKKRGELVTRFENLVHTLLDAVEEDIKENGVDAVRGTTAAAIATDKYQLLRSKPTAVIELQQAVEDGRIKREEVQERYPSIYEEFFANVARTENG